MKFLADDTLGRLSKWLRLLGFDTEQYHGAADRTFLRIAASRGRIAISRRRDLTLKQYSGRMIVIRSERLEEQMGELVRNFGLPVDEEKFFCLCLECNVYLEKISKRHAIGLVPSYILESQEEFRKCPACGRIFWAGTHRENAMNFLKRHNLIGHP